jgi:antitoxin YefM
MDVVSYSDARANLKGVMDRVVGDRTHVVITRQKAEAVVVVSLQDWNAMEETMHLLSTPANAERLRGSIRQLDGGGGTERELITEREPVRP